MIKFILKSLVFFFVSLSLYAVKPGYERSPLARRPLHEVCSQGLPIDRKNSLPLQTMAHLEKSIAKKPSRNFSFRVGVVQKLHQAVSKFSKRDIIKFSAGITCGPLGAGTSECIFVVKDSVKKGHSLGRASVEGAHAFAVQAAKPLGDVVQASIKLAKSFSEDCSQFYYNRDSSFLNIREAIPEFSAASTGAIGEYVGGTPGKIIGSSVGRCAFNYFTANEVVRPGYEGLKDDIGDIAKDLVEENVGELLNTGNVVNFCTSFY